MRISLLRFGISIVLICLLSLKVILWLKTSHHVDPSDFRNHPIFLKLSDLSAQYKLQPDEITFPLAFSLQIYTDIDLAIRLLRAIYRPHNFYCIHVDKRSSLSYYSAMEEAVRRTGKNVILVPNEDRIPVDWGSVSTLEADILCSRLLLRKDSTWKYWINLTGHEFPLRTNWELVAALKALNQTNVVIGSLKPNEPYRVPPSSLTKFPVRWSKGSAHVAVRREFVEYMNTNPKAAELLEALRKWEYVSRRVTFSDEFYFSTLNHNPSLFPIPGAYLGVNGSETQNPLIVRYKVWQFELRPCGSNHWQRQICIFGLADLPALKSSVYFFANKFAPNFEPEAYDQLEKWIQTKTDYESAYGEFHPSFQPDIYSKFEIAHNHL
ncbi:unnamed protein product [Calicophoron daubneyi]|uniref:Beta-1,3-galactosyl-O-glycosyl-glycoprotein beta-1,6-N-acetylglucosaminyltransferase n=1 Tax=Calicophoron daubneyi TaxID=300641 RepID=A0AAV2TUT3_CALDB